MGLFGYAIPQEWGGLGLNIAQDVELAMELAAGSGFYRAAGLERRFRDVQGARYHPMRRDVQRHYTGALTLGDPVARIY